VSAPQKVIAVLGLLAIIATAFQAPYEYRAHNEAARIGGNYQPYTAVTHAPIWKQPVEGDAPMWLFEETRRVDMVEEIHLDAGRLGLWWGAIAAVTVVAIVLAAPKGEVR